MKQIEAHVFDIGLLHNSNFYSLNKLLFLKEVNIQKAERRNCYA